MAATETVPTEKRRQSDTRGGKGSQADDRGRGQKRAVRVRSGSRSAGDVKDGLSLTVCLSLTFHGPQGQSLAVVS